MSGSSGVTLDLHQCDWLSSSIHFLCSCPHTEEHLKQKSHDQPDFLHYRFILSSFSSAIFLAKQVHFSSLIRSHTCNPSCLFTTFDSLLKPSALPASTFSPHRISPICSKRKWAKQDTNSPSPHLPAFPLRLLQLSPPSSLSQTQKFLGCSPNVICPCAPVTPSCLLVSPMPTRIRSLTLFRTSRSPLAFPSPYKHAVVLSS